MNTVNIVLMILLSTMIGFAIGNVWGKETMKKIFSDMISKMIEGMKVATESDKGKLKKE